ncbi:MAG: adenylylsulfate kinase [Alphaproteobacteria bacterium]|nr:adenylylsulfate kinase [Alphaproteobacteria bacterium]
MTGISGVGKTTLSDALARRFKPVIPELIQIDGDEIRALFGASLDYAEPDRYKQIQRIQRLAHLLDKQGMVVLVAALYGHPDLFKWNRENFSDYFEAYIEAPLELVQRRDSKSLYKKAAAGEMPNVVGIDIPWNAPQNPHLKLDATAEEDPDRLALEVARRIPYLARHLDGADELQAIAQAQTP